MSAKYKSPSFLLPNELNTSANTANDTGINSLYSIDQNSATRDEKLNIGGLNLGTTNTISMWLKFRVTGSDTILGCPSSSALSTSLCFLSSTALRFQIGTNNNADFDPSPGGQPLFPIDEWKHMVVTKTGTTLKLFIDGVYKEEVSIGNGNINTVVDHIGNRSGVASGQSAAMRGQIDEVSFYTSALTYGDVSIGQSVSSDSEIAKLYDSVGSSVVPSNLMATSLSPVAYYPLGEQAQNSSYPSATGNEWQFPNGVLQDYVMDFDGSASSAADFVSTSNTSIGNIGSNPHTFSAWINIADHGQVQTILSNKSSNGWKFEVSSGASPDNITFYISGSNLLRATFPSSSYGSWINVVAVVNGSSSKIYINGVDQSASVTGTLIPPDSTEPLIIGAQDNGSGTYIRSLNGQMSNVQIFNSALPETGSNSIEILYNSGSPLTDMSGFTSLTNWWKLNADSVYTPSAPNYTTALDFNGSSDYIDCGTSQLVDFNSSFTISAWVYITSSASGYDCVYAFKGASHPFAMFFNNSTGYSPISFGIANYPTDGTIKCATNVTINQWNNIVVVYNGNGIATPSNYTFYINNESQTLTTSAGFSDIGNVNYIGRYDPSHAFDGSVSNVAVFNSALSSSQVSTLFNFGTPETAISFSPTAWWKLDDQTAITDSSGNGNTGTNNGATDISSGVAYVPSWKIPSALPIPSANYTTALEFNGLAGYPSHVASYIDTNYTGLSGATEFSMSFWLKCDDITADNSFFGNRNNSNQGISCQINSSLFYLYTQNGANWVTFTTDSVGVVSGEWFNIIIFYNGSGASNTDRLKIYINKDIVSYSVNGAVPSSLNVSTQPLWVGSGNRVSNGFGGKISNFALWNTNQLTNLNNIWNLGTPQLSSYTVTPTIWYKMTDTTSGIQDSSGNNNNGTNSNSTKVFSNVVAGNIPVNGVSTTLQSTALQQSDLQFDSPYSNYSLSFDGTGQYINCGTSNISELQVLSLSCWFKEVDSSNTGTRAIIANKNYSSNNGVALWIFGSDLVFQIAAQNDNLSWNNSRVVIFRNYAPIGSWHHISCTYDGTDAKIYINGVLRNTWTPTQPYTVYYSPTYNELRIANRSDTTGAPFVGKIDETAIFNTALTEAQVLEIYNNGKPGNLDNFSGTAPISWWRLGENAYFNTGTTPGPEFTVPNSIAGAPNGVGSGTVTTMLSADAPGTYANGIGTNLDITDRVGDAPLSVANSQSYNMIPDDKVLYVPGYVGAQTTNAFEMTFDGVDDYFNAGDFSSLIDQTVSVSMWFKTTSTFSSNEDLLSFGLQTTGSVSTQRIFFASSGILVASINNGSGGYATTSYSGLNDGDWHHLVCMWEGGSVANGIKIYVDGSLADQVNSTQSLTSAVQFIIGENLHYNSNFDGSIDEVAIFDKALTADQVKFDLYEPTALVGGVEKTADIENNTNLPTPVAWYRMGD